MVTSDVVTQAVFGAAVGISQQAVSELVGRGILIDGQGADVWLLAYCHRLREQAAGRMGDEVGGLDLAQERAALAREQRKGIEIKNALLRGQYASVSLLSEVLASASQAVAERFDHLPGQLRKALPDLDPAVVDQVMTRLAEARNEWVRQTTALVSASITSVDDEDDEALEFDDEPRTN